MNRDDILRMARQANLEGYPEELERFAVLVAASEREACAKVCEESNAFDWQECAAEIRARGETK